MVRLRTPAGTRDVLPTEAAELRVIEDAVRLVFRGFGYGEVVTPTLEYEEVLALSEEAALLTGFRMLDEPGGISGWGGTCGAVPGSAAGREHWCGGAAGSTCLLGGEGFRGVSPGLGRIEPGEG